MAQSGATVLFFGVTLYASGCDDKTGRGEARVIPQGLHNEKPPHTRWDGSFVRDLMITELLQLKLLRQLSLKLRLLKHP